MTFSYFSLYICSLSFLPSPPLFSSLLSKLLFILKDKILLPHTVKISLSEMLSPDTSASPHLPTFIVTPWNLTSSLPWNHSFKHYTIQLTPTPNSLTNANDSFSVSLRLPQSISSPVAVITRLCLYLSPIEPWLHSLFLKSFLWKNYLFSLPSVAPDCCSPQLWMDIIDLLLPTPEQFNLSGSLVAP